MSDRPNILILFSDEHAPHFAGWMGNPEVKTPNLDRLAADSASFDNAYCNCPICLPSRASFLTGQYVSRIQTWDNGSPFPQDFPTFATHLSAAGYDTTLCGRMHVIGPNRTCGFDRRLMDDPPRWIFKNTADRRPSWRRGSNSHVTQNGPGWADNQLYDRQVSDLTCRFLHSLSTRASSQPWLFLAGFMSPHFPLICPPEFLELYDPDSLTLPSRDRPEDWRDRHHSVTTHMLWAWRNDEELPEEIERQALACYYGLVSYLDHLVGQILDALEASGQAENTLVLYSSDHGEMAGHHNHWQKQCFYERAVRVPLLARGPGFQPGKIQTAASLADVFPTVLQAARQPLPQDLPGRPLQDLQNGNHPDRPVFSEYHCQGMEHAAYMLRQGEYKYIHYVGHDPELFHLPSDPGEWTNLASEPACQNRIREFDTLLRSIVDPESTDQAARRLQTTHP